MRQGGGSVDVASCDYDNWIVSCSPDHKKLSVSGRSALVYVFQFCICGIVLANAVHKNECLHTSEMAL